MPGVRPSSSLLALYQRRHPACRSPVGRRPDRLGRSDRRCTGQRSWKIGLGTKSGAHRKCPLWVTSGGSGNALFESAPPHKADVQRTFNDRRLVPIAAVSRCSKRYCYSITSSARESRLSEILTPSALAVLRLITSSNLVDCNTGSSAGLAPLRIFAA